MRALRLAGLVLSLAAATACGKSESQKQAEEAAKSLEQAGKSLEQMAKGLEGLAAAANNGQAVEPVSFKELQAVFVPIDGWEMEKPTGQRMGMPVAHSQAEVTYRKGDARIDVTVTDSALNQLLVAPIAMFLTTGYEKETKTGYEKSAQVAGYPGWEKWDTSRKDGELNAVVNKRFIVNIDGNNVEDMKVLYAFASATNLAKLESLK